MNVTLRQIQVFLAVAELSSFTRAAERLRMAQPALSQHVRDLEEELGLRLFDRTTRRVELTAAGREFRIGAAKIVEDLELAVRDAKELAERKRGRIVIATPPLLATVILPQAIADLRSRYPGIRVAMTELYTKEIVDCVRSGQADCGIGTFAPAETGIERVPLTRDSLMLFCSHASHFSTRKQVTWNDLKDQSLITLTRESGIRLLVEVGYEAAGLPLKPAYEVHQIATAIALVEAGLGCTVLPTYAWTEARTRKVVAKPLTQPSIARDIVMIHASRRTMSPAVLAFEPVLRKYAQRLKPKESA